MIRKYFQIVTLGLVLGVACAHTASAQGVNYVDESGNVIFADTAAQVPVRYRAQVEPPKVIRLSPREYKKYVNDLKRQSQLAEREKKKKEKIALKAQQIQLKKEQIALEKKQRELREKEKEAKPVVTKVKVRTKSRTNADPLKLVQEVKG